MFRYPAAKPDFSGNEENYLMDAIQSGWASSNGPYVEKFEKAFAKYMGTKYAVACSSGTNALVIALRSLGGSIMGLEGAEVIVPEFTMVASAWAVTQAGGKPVFVDCDDSLNINLKHLESKITDKTVAIMPVHIYGRPVNMDKLRAIADKYKLAIVEDACEAHGGTYNGKKVGTFGKVGCFSLFGNKIITAGEGGICVTNDKSAYDEMVKLRGMYFEPTHTFLHKKMGYNFRMTNLQAAVALAQLERIDEFLLKRKQILAWYDEYLVEYTLPRPPGSVLWMYDIVVDSRKRDELMEYLAGQGIESRMFFKPMSQQPMYEGSYLNLNAFAYSTAGLYLPAYTGLNQEDVKTICQTTLKFLQT